MYKAIAEFEYVKCVRKAPLIGVSIDTDQQQ
jgi:hypothetical protein